MDCDAGKLRGALNMDLYLQLVQMSCLEERPPAAGLAWLFIATTGSGAIAHSSISQCSGAGRH